MLQVVVYWFQNDAEIQPSQVRQKGAQHMHAWPNSAGHIVPFSPQQPTTDGGLSWNLLYLTEIYARQKDLQLSDTYNHPN